MVTKPRKQLLIALLGLLLQLHCVFWISACTGSSQRQGSGVERVDCITPLGAKPQSGLVCNSLRPVSRNVYRRLQRGHFQLNPLAQFLYSGRHVSIPGQDLHAEEQGTVSSDTNAGPAMMMSNITILRTHCERWKRQRVAADKSPSQLATWRNVRHADT